MIPKVRAVLFLADGRTWSTMSKPCLRTIEYLAKACHHQRWDPPICLEVREHPLEGGRSYCDLRELPPNEAKQTKVAANGKRDKT